MIHTALTGHRTFPRTSAAAALMVGVTGARRDFSAEPVKTAGTTTVPVGQRQVSRIHKAAATVQERGDIDCSFSGNVSNTDYARMLREYAEAGNALIIGKVIGAEQEARELTAENREVAFLMWPGFKKDPAPPDLAIFDNYIQDAS